MPNQAYCISVSRMEKNCTSAKTPIEHIEQRFMSEARQDGSLRWKKLFSDGSVDQYGNEWHVYCDESQKDSIEHGWQLYWLPKGADEYRWAIIKTVIHSVIPSSYETYQFDISEDGDGKMIFTVFRHKDATGVILYDELKQGKLVDAEELSRDTVEDKNSPVVVMKPLGRAALKDVVLAA